MEWNKKFRSKIKTFLLAVLVPCLYTSLFGMDLGGDFRLREELNVIDDSTTQSRVRFRLRMGSKVDIHEKLKLGFRLATNGGNPKSTHVNMTDGFKKESFVLDRAFIDWKPMDIVIIQAGKFGNPIKKSKVYGDLVWDGDIQPEGVALIIEHKSDGLLESVGFYNGTYFASHIQTRDDNNMVQINQLFINLVLGAAKIHGATNTLLFVDDTTANGDNNFVSQSFLSISFTGFPITVSGEFITNLGAKDDNLGFATGVKIGKIKQMGDLQLYYQFQKIEANSVNQAYVQDDFTGTGGGTFIGHMAGLKFPIVEKVGLHVYTMLADPDGGDLVQRYRGDVNFKW